MGILAKIVREVVQTKQLRILTREETEQFHTEFHKEMSPWVETHRREQRHLQVGIRNLLID